MPTTPTYPKNIQSLLRRLKTPVHVQRWIHSLQYNKAKTMRTLPGVIRTRRAHCLEAAMTAAAILEAHGYPPLILDLESVDLIDHTLFLYKEHGQYGTVAMSRDIGLYGRKPVYKSLRALVQSYAAPYIDHQAAIKAYGVLDLRTLTDQRWRTSPKNVWYVEEALRNIPHKKFSLSTARVRYWRQRFLAHKKQYPDREPDYYPNQHAWH